MRGVAPAAALALSLSSGCVINAVDDDSASGPPTSSIGDDGVDDDSATTDPATGSTGTGDGSSGGTVANPTFDDHVAAILETNCGGAGTCHFSDALPAGGLFFGDGYAAIVEVPSTSVVGLNIVTSGSLQDSYLWHKIDGTFMDVGGTGSPMPLVGMLSAADKTIIQTWIENGAPEN